MQAMEHFAASSLDLTTLLRLFPTIKIPSWVSSLHHSREEVVATVDHEMDEFAEITPESRQQLQGKTDHSACSALAGFLLAKRDVVIGKVEAEETSATVAAIVKDTGLQSSAERDGNTQVSRHARWM